MAPLPAVTLAPKALWGLLVLALALGAYFLWPSPLGGRVSYVMVSGPSMEPSLRGGDLVLVRPSVSYAVGEVVAYVSPVGTIVHRIVGGSPEAGFVLKGDNRETTDPYRPRPHELLGKVWLRVPSGAIPLAYLRRPANALVLAVSLLGLLLLGTGAKRRKRKRRPLTAQPSAPQRHRRWRTNFSPGTPLVCAAALALLGLLALGSAAYGFSRSPQRPEVQQVPLYEHTGRFEYWVDMQPSTLYPEGRLGPVKPQADGGEVALPNPIFTRLARTLHLTYLYEMQGQGPVELTGQVSASLTISAGENGWRKTLPLAPARTFDGRTVSLLMAVDLHQAQEIIRAIEAETGSRASSYQLTLLPTVELRGRVAGETVEDAFQAPFTLRLAEGQLVPERQLLRHEPRYRSRVRWQPEAVPLWRLDVPVALWRWASLGAAALFLSLAAAAGVAASRAGGGSWAEPLYRPLIVELESPPDTGAGVWVAVATLRDLARVARLVEGAIFKWRHSDGVLYFVRDATATYFVNVVGKEREESGGRPGPLGGSGSPGSAGGSG